jgi:hypothetical protein
MIHREHIGSNTLDFKEFFRELMDKEMNDKSKS